MNATDYRQVYQLSVRALSELRGIASRLHKTDDDAAAIVERTINELSASWQELARLYRAQHETEGQPQ